MKTFLQKNKVSAIAVTLLIVIALLFSQKTYYALIIALFGVYAIVAISLDILFGYTGQISLGHAGLFAIGSYVATQFTMKLGIPSLISLILGAILTMLVGFVVAIPASKLVKHFLSLLMIAFGQMIYLIVNTWTPVTGGSLGIGYIPYLNVCGIVLNSNLKNSIFIWILVALTMVAKNRIIDSRTGRAFIAIRENAVAARGLGINVQRYKILAFGISAFLTGLAGGLYAFLRGFISPETFNGTQSILFMTMLLFGGITTSAGPVIGAAVLLLVKELFQSLSIYQGLIYALFILVVLFFLPNGAVGLYYNILHAIKKKRNKKLPSSEEEVKEVAENA